MMEGEGLYYEQNKKRILAQQKAYYERNRSAYLVKKREFYAENADRIRRERRLRWEATESQEAKEKVRCDCGSIITRGALPRHKTNGPHMDWLHHRATLSQYKKERGIDEGYFKKAARMAR